MLIVENASTDLLRFRSLQKSALAIWKKVEQDVVSDENNHRHMVVHFKTLPKSETHRANIEFVTACPSIFAART